mgnify:CR=1 FL=1|tara:strand:+ start:218 stop:682 length:465 start_codon:yes stop_codon:yes gene_type:complete
MANNQYIAQFEKAKIKTVRFREEGFYDYGVSGIPVKVESRESGKCVLFELERPEQGVFEFDYNGYKVDLYMPSDNGIVEDVYIKDAKYVLAMLDDWLAILVAKDLLDLSQDDLAWINVSDTDIELHFVGINVNSEYSAYFERDKDGVWFVEGLG